MVEDKKSEKMTFVKEMRVATREIHNISDALVNLKLGVAMSQVRGIDKGIHYTIQIDFMRVKLFVYQDSVWAEGLLVFYEIFNFLERAMDDHGDSLIGELDVPGKNPLGSYQIKE